jgi:hypothetical protein
MIIESIANIAALIGFGLLLVMATDALFFIVSVMSEDLTS